jgi:hypothetical protein
MTFNEYLDSKKINPEAFKTWNLSTYLEWEQAFAQYHPDSFTMQFKFVLNNTRRALQAWQNTQPTPNK